MPNGPIASPPIALPSADEIPTAAATSDSAPGPAPGPAPDATADSGPGLDDAALRRIAAALTEDRLADGRIGRYRLIEVIGAGGMGEVWRAEQEEPIRRTVALKLIKLGMDSREVIARFEAERQALARMSHPNVAAVLDAGATDTGRPYFVMDFVIGEPITGFCDRHRCTIEQRLRLFSQACAAVGHAHQKGILHRDLKPANILVTTETGEPQVKVIDFGVAKALAAAAGDSDAETIDQACADIAVVGDGPPLTLPGQLLGTPEYMSPEQALSDGRDVDTASDIYSLGVVLYELLAGARPFDSHALHGAGGLAELRRVISEVEPTAPGARLTGMGDANAAEVARRRDVPLGALRRRLAGELGWIPLKSMRKERSERYASVADLARDIENFLAHKPLLAGPDSRRYRAKKFIRRNHVALAVAGAFVAFMVGGTATYIHGVRAEQVKTLAALAEAERNARETDQVAAFQGRMLSTVNVRLMGRRLREDLVAEARRGWQQSRLSDDEIARRTTQLQSLVADANFTNAAVHSLDQNVFQRALTTIRQEFATQPRVKARLLQHVATVMVRLGLYDAAAVPQAEALTIRRAELGNDDPDTLDSLYATAFLFCRKGDYRASETHITEALESRRRRGDVRETLGCMLLLGDVLARQGHLEEAERYKRQNLDGCVSAFGNEDRQTLFARLQLGQIIMWQGHLAEAQPYLEEALDGMRRKLPKEHPDTLLAMGVLGTQRIWAGDLAGAESLLRESVAGNRANDGDDNREAIHSRRRFAEVLRRRGNLGEAEVNIQAALEAARASFGPEHIDTLWIDEELASLREAQGRLDEAETRFAELYRRAPQTDLDPQSVARLMSGYGPCLAHRARYAEASAPLLEAHRRLKETGLAWDGRMFKVVEALITVCEHTDRADDALAWRAELPRLRAATQPASAPASQPATPRPSL